MNRARTSLDIVQGRLSRSEMKQVMGGKVPPGGGGNSPSLCYWGTESCYEANGIKYTCYVNWVNDEEECCCGHSSGNENCYAT